MDCYNNLVLMKKDANTNFFIETLASYEIKKNMEYIDKIYEIEENNQEIIYLTLTTLDIDEDYKYYGIYDLYNEDIFGDLILQIEKADGGYNPKWVLKIEYNDNVQEMDDKLNHILSLHVGELNRIIPLIKEEDYSDDEE